MTRFSIDYDLCFNIAMQFERSDIRFDYQIDRPQLRTLTRSSDIGNIYIEIWTSLQCDLCGDSNFITRFVWDMVSLLIIGVETVTVPMILAFPDMSMPLQWVYFVITFFLLDIFVNFVTGFESDIAILYR